MLAMPETLDHVPLKHYGNNENTTHTHHMVAILADEFGKRLIATGDDWHTVMNEITEKPMHVHAIIRMLDEILSDNSKMTKYTAHAIGSALFHYFRTVREENANALPFIPRAERVVKEQEFERCKLKQTSAAGCPIRNIYIFIFHFCSQTNGCMVAICGKYHDRFENFLR